LIAAIADHGSVKPLSVRGYEQVLDLVMGALDDEAVSPWASLADSLRDAVGGTAAIMLNTAPSVSVLAWTRSAVLDKADERVRRFRPSHPLTAVFAAGERAPMRVSDVIGSAAWRRNPVYDLSRREVDGSTFHLGIPINRHRNALIVRSGADFPRRSVDFACRLRPVLARLDRHLGVLERVRAAAPPTHDGDVAYLTPRELTILGLLANGLTAAAIGRRLNIRTATVSKHQENLYRKLGTNDRLTTVLQAQKCGLIRPS
jgi:DNA-binding CsgD family transcriptional regulator